MPKVSRPWSVVYLLILVVAPICLAADTPAPPAERPKSASATAAISRAEKAQAQADADHKAAVLQAKRVEIGELRAAQDAAMKNGGAGLAEANAIETVIKQVQAEVDAMEKGAAPTKPGPGAEASGVVAGRWRITYTNKAVRVYVFNSDGTVERVDDKAKIHPVRQGAGLLLDFGDGKIERATQSGDRLIVEHFITKTDYPTKAGAVGLGVRSAE